MKSYEKIGEKNGVLCTVEKTVMGIEVQWRRLHTQNVCEYIEIASVRNMLCGYV